MKQFLVAVYTALTLFGICTGVIFAQTNSRLTSSKNDEAIVTVGGSVADISGFTSEAIQLAVDAVNANGGGTVKLNPGRFECTEPVRLYSNIKLAGSGKKTVLHKSEGVKTRLTADGDSCSYSIAVEDPSCFKTGMEIQVYFDGWEGLWKATRGVITGIEGDILYLDTPLLYDCLVSKKAAVTNAFPIVDCLHIENVRISDFMIDGSAETNVYIHFYHGAGIRIFYSKNFEIENIHITNFNGDTFLWAFVEDINLRNCEASYGTHYGFHPGGGCYRTNMENCIAHHNKSNGLFLCWNVQNCVFRNNVFYENDEYGISIGHQDTDNIFLNNHVYENKKHGVCLREETEENSGHRNTFRNNTIENNGSESFEAYGFYIGGITRDIVIEDNIIRSTGKGNQVGAVCIGPNSSHITVKNNTVSGHPGTKQE